jgi:hypothetical protein
MNSVAKMKLSVCVKLTPHPLRRAGVPVVGVVVRSREGGDRETRESKRRDEQGKPATERIEK